MLSYLINCKQNINNFLILKISNSNKSYKIIIPHLKFMNISAIQ